MLGQLFVFFMSSAGSYTDNRLFSKLYSQSCTMDIPIDGDQQEYFINRCCGSYAGWLLYHLNAVGSTARRQMFYITFVSTFFGLSRSGVQLLKDHGYGVSLDMYDDYRKYYGRQQEYDARYYKIDMILLN